MYCPVVAGSRAVGSPGQLLDRVYYDGHSTTTIITELALRVAKVRFYYLFRAAGIAYSDGNRITRTLDAISIRIAWSAERRTPGMLRKSPVV